MPTDKREKNFILDWVRLQCTPETTVGVADEVCEEDAQGPGSQSVDFKVWS